MPCRGESKTKKWTRVPRLPHEEAGHGRAEDGNIWKHNEQDQQYFNRGFAQDERNEKSENVPKLPRKGKRNPRSQKTTKAVGRLES